MRLFRRRGGAALAEPPPRERDYDFQGSDDELRAEIDRLAAENRVARDPENERRLLELRHLAGIRLMDAHAGGSPQHPEPDYARLPEADELPEIPAAELTPELLRAGILRDGCLLVRGLVDRTVALHFADEIERSLQEREAFEQERRDTDAYYEEFELHPRYPELKVRAWIKQGGGVLAADSPKLAFEMVEMFRAAGIPQLVDSYLGEPGMITAHKTTLRKVDPWIPGAWHQDGSFMGEVRALNLWLSLSRCGDESPGLDLVPRRLDDFVATATDDAVLDMQVSQAKAEEAAGDKPIIRPIFEPGDALLFDDRFLHATGSDPSMPKPRYAIESWFFGGSAFPADYAPIAV